MKSSTIAYVVSVLLLAGCATPGSSPTKWEYRTEVLEAGMGKLQDHLNALGQDSWELVDATDIEGSSRTKVILKRRMR